MATAKCTLLSRECPSEGPDVESSRDAMSEPSAQAREQSRAIDIAGGCTGARCTAAFLCRAHSLIARALAAKDKKLDERTYLLTKELDSSHGLLAEAEGREASLCDLLNSWARESQVEEADRPEDSKAVSDRLWACWSQKLAEKDEELARALTPIEAGRGTLRARIKELEGQLAAKDAEVRTSPTTAAFERLARDWPDMARILAAKDAEVAHWQALHSSADDRLSEALNQLAAKDAELAAARRETEKSRRWVDDLQAGMYINCVYCGHRYGPDDQVSATMAQALKEHIGQCPKHPMSALKKQRAALEAALAAMRGALEPFAHPTVAGDTFLVTGADVNRARAALASSPGTAWLAWVREVVMWFGDWLETDYDEPAYPELVERGRALLARAPEGVKG